MKPSTTTSWRHALRAFALLLTTAYATSAFAREPVPAAPDAATPAVDALLAAARTGDARALQAALPAVERPGLEALLRARLAASRLQAAAVDAQLQRYWRSDDRNPTRDALAWSIAADAAFASGHYAQAADATQAWAALLASDDPRDEAAGVAQFHGIARILSDAPAQAVLERDPQPTPTQRDKAGLLRTRVQVNGIGQDAVLDTGANLSVASHSAAERLGIRLLGAEASVASGSREHVATGLGIAAQLEIAGVTLSNVVFLVLADDDLQLPLPGGYKIDAIIGFPVLRAIGRMRFGDDRLTPLEAPAAHAAATGNLHAIGNDLFVDAAVDGVPMPLHLDTGAPTSFLSTRFAALHPQRLHGLERRDRHSASAGGAITQQAVTWDDVVVTIDGQPMTLPQLQVMVSEAAAVDVHTLGTLGLDVLDGFDAYTLDLRAMRLEVERGE